ncbi:MAG: hypothetical protein GX455_03140 [Phycisphaerae bacterium]|nr:hypothetical protein [Phycisphaerae bacterium]
MKNSKDYAKQIDKLFRRMRQDRGKIALPNYADPLPALIDGIFLEHWTAAQTHAALKRIHEHFVDDNDLRVARQDEVLDAMGVRDASARSITTSLLMSLMAIFNRHDQLRLQFLCEQGKRQARKELDLIAGLTPFAIDYCFLHALDGHTIPLNRVMIDYLKAEGLVHPESTDEEIQGFLVRQISAAQAREFATLLHAEAMSAAAEAARKAAKPAPKRKKS